MQGGDGDQAGIIPRMNQQLFLKVEEEKSKHETILFLITVLSKTTFTPCLLVDVQTSVGSFDSFLLLD